MWCSVTEDLPMRQVFCFPICPPGGDRTPDLVVKSHLLYQLSYERMSNILS